VVLLQALPHDIARSATGSVLLVGARVPGSERGTGLLEALNIT
jgi:hypothetical protein